MPAMIKVVFWVSLKLFLVGSAIFYTGLVLIAYTREGPSYRPRLDVRDPARSLDNFLVWLGVKTLAALLRASRAVLESLYEASGDVGEWYLRRRGHDVQSFVQSHLL